MFACCGDFLNIQQRRESFEGGDQLVKVKLYVIDCFRSGLVSRQAQHCFSGSSETRQILSVSWCDPLNKVLSDVPFEETLYRLNKKRFLPNDALIFKGEIFIYEENQTFFRTAEEFESIMGRTRSDFSLTYLCLAALIIVFLGFILKIFYFTKIALWSFVLWSLAVLFVVSILVSVFLKPLTRLWGKKFKFKIYGPIFIEFSPKDCLPFVLKYFWPFVIGWVQALISKSFLWVVLLSIMLFSMVNYNDGERQHYKRTSRNKDIHRRK